MVVTRRQFLELDFNLHFLFPFFQLTTTARVSAHPMLTTLFEGLTGGYPFGMPGLCPKSVTLVCSQARVITVFAPLLAFLKVSNPISPRNYSFSLGFLAQAMHTGAFFSNHLDLQVKPMFFFDILIFVLKFSEFALGA